MIFGAAERAHCQRLELWVASLLCDMRRFNGIIAAREADIETLKEQKKKDDAEHKYQVR
jgi:hypothetical protein